MTDDPNQHASGHRLAEPTPPQTPQPASLEGILAAAWTQASGPTPPPIGWLTRTAAAITAHLQLDLDQAREAIAIATVPDTRDAQALAHLRHQVRQRLADAVAQGNLDGELANEMLDQFGLPLLRRLYQVRIGVTIKVEVSATDEDDAYDLAEDAIEEALLHADRIELTHEDGERIHATAGEFDDDGTDD
jgi:hypothetical protein